MRKRLIFVNSAFVSMIISICSVIVGAQSNEIQTNGKVCSDPSSACGKSFSDEALSFRLPAKLTWQRNYYSASFYAIILKSRAAVVDTSPMEDERCSQGYYSEQERKRIQKLFPSNKVFATRNGCYMPTIWYTNANNNYEFIAVYAGETEAQAKTFLKQVKAKKEFSGANIRKMKVVYGNGD